MLIKKTVVLTSDVTVGYITLVRVGDSVGIKAVLNSEPHEKLYLGLRAGSKPQINAEITSRRTERDIEVDLNAMDDLGAILVDSDGKIVATGGKKEAVNAEKIYEAFSVKGEANAESAAVSETQKVSSEAEEVIADDAVSAPAYGEDAADETETDENAVNDIEDSETKEKETVIEEKEETPVSAPRAANGFDKGNFPPFSANKGENFYRNIRSRLEEIMTANPREEELEKLIPESKWVKVFYDDEEYYVVGILSEAGEVTFLAYGVPGIEGIKPPKEAEELCDFLAIPGTVGEGYWLMFQNAKNGDIMKSI